MAQSITIIYGVSYIQYFYTLGRARLISLKTPAMLMNAMIYKTMSDKVEAFHAH